MPPAPPPPPDGGGGMVGKGVGVGRMTERIGVRVGNVPLSPPSIIGVNVGGGKKTLPPSPTFGGGGNCEPSPAGGC